MMPDEDEDDDDDEDEDEDDDDDEDEDEDDATRSKLFAKQKHRVAAASGYEKIERRERTERARNLIGIVQGEAMSDKYV
ncbi:hypothetical protein M0802_015182 [Mischocyttarus mexicanus]|nr:hypothetical protein M0802_015182 [Mischocyttarus mexicanus]